MAADLKLGDVLGGRYRLDSVLGSGGAGDVYAAWDEVQDKKVAVKLSEVGTPDAAERLIRESDALAHVDSPAIVRWYGAGRYEDRVFLARELVDGSSVQELLLSRGPFDEPSALAVAIAVTGGLAELHRHGLLHRDLKPSNVIVPVGPDDIPRFGEAKLIDLDVLGQLTRRVSATRHTTMTGQFFGTPLYMAPEQIAALPQDPRTDVYGAGMLLYEMLVGRSPFEAGGSPTDLLLRIMSERVAFPATPSIRPALRKLIARCLEKDARQRYQDGAELLAALTRIAAPTTGVVLPGDTGLGLALGAAPETRPLKRRARAIALSLAAAVVAGAFVAGVIAGLPHIATLGMGIGSVAVSIAAGVLLHRLIERKRPALLPDLGRLLGRTAGASDLRKSIALDLDELLAACREVDQRIMVQTLAFMVTEYERAKKSADRQDALMKAVTLLEKLMQRLSPWYVRQQKTISWGVSIVGSLGGIAKVVSAIVNAGAHP